MSSHSNRDLKQRVLTSLDRLGDRDTQAQATAELDLISRSLSPETSLPTFLSCLLSVDSSHRSPVRVHSLRLISSLAASHGPHLSPHLPKILSSLLRRLRDPDTAVRSACSDAAASLARHLTSSPFSAFLDPLLAALLSEQDLNAQIGASLCLSAAVDSSHVLHAPDLRRSLPKLLKLARSDGFRAKPALLTLIASVVAADGGAVVNGPGLMASVVACAVELLSCDDWAARKAAAEVLEKVALAVPNRRLVVEFKTVCLTALDKRRFDKVKIAREAMNRALEAWKAVNDLSSEDLPLSQPQSSPPKDKRNVIYSPESSDRQNFGFETPEPKKNWINSRSSLSDCSTVTGSPPISNCSGDASSQTPQLNKSKSNSRSSVSSLSDDSTVAVAKKESLQNASGKKSHVRKPHARRKPLDWKVEEDAAPTMSAGVGSEQRNSESVESVENSSSSIGSSSKKTFNNSLYEDHGRRSSTSRGFGTRVVPLQDSQRVDGEANEQVYDNSADFEDISLIRKQLVQIERQQANLTELLQRFMGTSQSGINSLETRVSGLEKALDGISHNLAMQGCRIPNESAGNSCCSIRGAEFLSPKFWRKNENGRFAASSSCYSGNMNPAPHKDDNVHIRDMRDITHADLIRDSGRNSDVNLPTTRSMTKCMKGISQRRACSVGSLDGASPRACTTPVVQRT